MDMEFMAKYAPMYLEAAGLTIKMAAYGIAGAFAAGIVCSLIKELRVPVLFRLVDIYIELSRNTPLLIQLFFLYFGLPKLGIVLTSEACGIIGLIFLGGSYMAEGFRTGIDNVPRVQRETAYSLGMTKKQTFWQIVMPQAVATSVPVFCANIIFLLKETSVFSAVALMDLVYVTKDLIGLYYKTDEALLMLVISYLVILLPISMFGSWLERRVRYAGFGNTGSV